MKGFTVQAQINRPPREVWNFLTDLRRAPRWMKDVESIESLDGEPIGLGSRFQTVTTAAGSSEERETRVTGWEPQRCLALSSQASGISATYTYILEDLGDRTAVKLRAECRARRLWKLVHPLVIYLMKRHDGDQLQLLKRAIEAPGR